MKRFRKERKPWKSSTCHLQENTLLANARIESLQRDLAVALGETDVLTGWLLFDLGRGGEAADAWRSTLKIAKETGDRARAHLEAQVVDRDRLPEPLAEVLDLDHVSGVT